MNKFTQLLTLLDTFDVEYLQLSDTEIVIPCPAVGYEVDDDDEDFEPPFLLPSAMFSDTSSVNGLPIVGLSDEACLHIEYDTHCDCLNWLIVMHEAYAIEEDDE